uniref:MIF4G domain-containing protein n=1 Tax=Syphacia muris TaxID=451379 RepID=A0A0N5AVL4_9BILA
MLVFKLFFFISKNFQLGIFHCLYLIFLNYYLSKSRDAITRPMLVNACEQCLLSNKKFGPFTFQLLVEKLLDDDIKEVEKTEIYCEPFVLEADLGLTSRALELCKTVYRSTASITQKFIEAVFQWLVQLSEGIYVEYCFSLGLLSDSLL